MGSKKLRALQLGQETTPGTAVAATVIWPGFGVLDDARELKTADMDAGFLTPVDHAYFSDTFGRCLMPDQEATYQTLPYILAAGIQNTVSGSADGAGSGKIYTYAHPTTAARTPKAFTIEAGDDIQWEEMEYALVENFRISARSREPWRFSANWFGRQVAQTTKTASLALPSTLHVIHFGHTKLYSDAPGSIGTTQVQLAFLSFDLNITTGFMPLFTGDGNLYFSTHEADAPTFDLRLRLRHTSAVETLKNSIWRGATSRGLQLLAQGPALTTAGTTYTYFTCRIDLYGKFIRFEPVTDENGINCFDVRMEGRYNGTAASAGQFIVVNESASLT